MNYTLNCIDNEVWTFLCHFEKLLLLNYETRSCMRWVILPRYQKMRRIWRVVQFQHLLPACICFGVHPGRVEPASPMWRFVDWWSTSPGVTALIGFVAQTKLARFVNFGASVLHTLPFGFDPGDAAGTQGIWAWTAEVCWLHRHPSDLFVSLQMLNLLPSPGILTLWHRTRGTSAELHISMNEAMKPARA